MFQVQSRPLVEQIAREEDWFSTEALFPSEEGWCHAEKWLEHQSAAQLTPPGTLTDGQHARAGIQSNVFNSNTTEGNSSSNRRGGKSEKEAKQ